LSREISFVVQIESVEMRIALRNTELARSEILALILMDDHYTRASAPPPRAASAVRLKQPSLRARRARSRIARAIDQGG
jgi:hypothetical protein